MYGVVNVLRAPPPSGLVTAGARIEGRRVQQRKLLPLGALAACAPTSDLDGPCGVGPCSLLLRHSPVIELPRSESQAQGSGSW